MRFAELPVTRASRLRVRVVEYPNIIVVPFVYDELTCTLFHGHSDNAGTNMAQEGEKMRLMSIQYSDRRGLLQSESASSPLQCLAPVHPRATSGRLMYKEPT